MKIKLITMLVLTISFIASAQNIGQNKKEPIDINSKSTELGITPQELESILNSAFNGKGEGDPLPDAMQERLFTGQNAHDWFGYSVSSAGDVNGDGYDDIIVGTPTNDIVLNDFGRAYIYYGGNIIDNMADVTLIGTSPEDKFGNSVSTAGDVNGDGYDDVIVAAYFNDNGGADAGIANIYFGGISMDNTPDVIMTGASAGDWFGISVSTAGDVNGDGFSDAIVGAWQNDAAGADAGRAYIFFGSSSMNNTADIVLTGVSAGDNFGNSVSDAGDVNGDGFSDVTVGAWYNDAGGAEAGRAYIFFGSSSMNNTADIVLTGVSAGDNFGNSVSAAGDVNDDGFSEVIVAAWGNDAGGSDAGGAYIFLGGSSMDDNPDVILSGAAVDDRFGFSVAAAGDVNGDAYDDVIVGAPYNESGGNDAGRAYIFFGAEIMDNIADAIMTGAAASDNFGLAVAFAGDMNSDGYSDPLVGAYRNDTNGLSSGRVYLYTNSLMGTDMPDEIINGIVDTDWFGYKVSTAGDVNGDGYTDIIVGAPKNDAGGLDAGSAYIYFGAATLDNIADLILIGATADDSFGKSVSTAGDVNGDGYADVIIGAPKNDAGGIDAGRAYIYYGGSIMDIVADVILTDASAGDEFGNSVSTAGDVNGDGYADVIVGAPYNDAQGSSAGRAYTYLGGQTMNNVVDITLSDAYTVDTFGYSVSNAGDVNNDGYDDVIVGAPLNDFGGNDAGRAFIYLGSSSMDYVADVSLTGQNADDRFGFSVSSAGDANGDGYSDVIVGAYNNDAGGFNAGSAYLFYGGFSMNSLYDVVFFGQSDGNFFGYSVSTAGDVNGDGYKDVAVGAYGNRDGGIFAGKAYIYFGGLDMDNEVDVTMTGNQFSGLGYSVAKAGDINKDGYDDVFIGSPDGGKAYLYLSSPPQIKPLMKSVKDIPLDQGGVVRVRWARSGYDIPGFNRISEYIIQRSDPPGTSGFVWDYVATIPALRELQYSYVAPTPYDSSSNSSGTFYFRVIALGTNPDEKWYSNIMYGHSVDNLSPAAPFNFYANLLTNQVKLGWKLNTEEDLKDYIIYRTDYPGANPDTLLPLVQLLDTTYIDTNPLSGTSYYYLRAQDIHNNFSQSVSVTVSQQTTFSLSVSVNNGWNMVSVPGLQPTDQNVNTWWAFRDQGANVFKYAGGYQSVTTAVPGTGYWMKHSGARTYNTGDEWPAGGIQIVAHDPLTGASGWNLIGGYELSVSSANVTTNPSGLQSGPIYKYSGGYAVVTTLDPGYGYWIKLISAGQIIIPEILSKGEKPTEWFPEYWGKIVFNDAEGRNIILYCVKDKVDLSLYELPPAPPSEMFDIRYSSGRIAEDLNSIMQTIEMNGITYPINIRVEGMDIRLKDETGKVINLNLKSGEDVIIRDATIQKLLALSELMPAEYSLEQNYPNPFNPSTQIKYVLAASGNVSLKVYDVLGNEVATLVNEEKPAGSYEVKFNAAGLSSGIYFYTLATGSFIETKKMILLK